MHLKSGGSVIFIFISLRVTILIYCHFEKIGIILWKYALNFGTVQKMLEPLPIKNYCNKPKHLGGC